MLKIAFDPIYSHPLPEGHRFPMLKYDLIPQQLLYEGVITSDSLFAPLPCSEELIALTHTLEYIEALREGTLDQKMIRKIGFPLSPDLYHREKVITQGTIDCALFAMQHGVALNVAGGTHHAFADKGEGFCLFNDFAVAANNLLHQKKVNQIMIIDLDVHQGNGTAKIFEQDNRVFTMSMHGRNNYPFHKEKSNLDIELEDGIDDEAYLELLEIHLPPLLNKMKPEIIFYLSGVDILNTDKFGKLNVSAEGCRKRDEYVFNLCKLLKTPVVAAMGGGYSPNIKDIVDAHCNTFKTAQEIFFN